MKIKISTFSLLFFFLLPVAFSQYSQGPGFFYRIGFTWQPNGVAVEVHFQGLHASRINIAGSTKDINPMSSNQGQEYDSNNIYEGWASGSEEVATIFLPSPPQSIPYAFVVTMWSFKISAAECAQRRGGIPCEYCQKNGYHFEGKQFSTNWITIDPFFQPMGKQIWINYR